MKFKTSSIRKQYNLLAGCILILVILLSAVSFIFVKNMTTKNIYNQVQGISKDLNKEMQMIYQKVDTIATAVFLDPGVENLMISPFSSETPYYMSEVKKSFSNYSSIVNEISDISLVSDSLTWSNLINAESAEMLRKEIAQTTDLQILGLISSPLTSHSSKKYLLLAENLYAHQNTEYYGKLLGSVFIFLDPKLMILSNSISYQNDSVIMLIDKKGNHCTLYGSNRNAPEIYNSLPDDGEVFTSESNDFLLSENYLIHVSPISSSDLMLISAFNKHTINKEVLQTVSFFIFIIILSCIILLLLFRVMIHNLITPLEHMVLYINQLTTNPGYPLNSHLFLDSCKEIRKLNYAFHHMLEEKEKLSRDLHTATVSLYETKLQKKQAELEFLRSQVNPHFLYNTLESIKNLALENQVPEIAVISNSLSKLFRYNVKGKNTVPLEQEISIVSAYMNIQNIRFGNRFDVIYSILEETKSILVMKFLLQPLVENSIIHGFSSTNTSGTLFISAHCCDQKLLITVQDDGLGIHAKQLEDLRHILSSPTSSVSEPSHVGLFNIQKRIQLMYGTDYGLEIDSQDNQGTRVTLTLPIIRS